MQGEQEGLVGLDEGVDLDAVWGLDGGVVGARWIVELRQGAIRVAVAVDADLPAGPDTPAAGGVGQSPRATAAGDDVVSRVEFGRAKLSGR